MSAPVPFWDFWVWGLKGFLEELVGLCDFGYRSESKKGLPILDFIVDLGLSLSWTLFSLGVVTKFISN